MSELRRAVIDGTYRVDALDVADAMLERWARFDVLEPRADCAGSDYAGSTTSEDDSSR